MIPAEAVEAAYERVQFHLDLLDCPAFEVKDMLEAALKAASPHMYTAAADSRDAESVLTEHQRSYDSLHCPSGAVQTRCSCGEMTMKSAYAEHQAAMLHAAGVLK